MHNAQNGTFEIIDESVDFEDTRLERLATTEGKQLPGEGGGPPSRAPNFADVFGNGAAALNFGYNQIAIAEDGSEKIIEIMSHSTRQLPKGFHFLRPCQLVLQGFACRHVHERANKPGGDAFFDASRRVAEQALQSLAPGKRAAG